MAPHAGPCSLSLSLCFPPGNSQEARAPPPRSLPPPPGATYLGSAAIRVSKVREGHGVSPRPASLFSGEFPPQARRLRTFGRAPPRFLTPRRQPSARGSAHWARREAEPRVAPLPSSALHKAPLRLAWSRRRRGPWMGRARERAQVPKGARRRGQVRRGAALCGSPGVPVQGGQRLKVTSR